MLHIVIKKRKKRNEKCSRAVSAFLHQNWPTHHSSLRHAQELQNWQPTCQYICHGLMFSVWLDRVASSRNSIKIIDFFMIFCDRVPRSERSDRISPQCGTISANGVNPPSKCIEDHACAITASGSIGASSCACATVGFCWKTA